MSKLADYPFEIRPITAEKGGGFLISYPDFSECQQLTAAALPQASSLLAFQRRCMHSSQLLLRLLQLSHIRVGAKPLEHAPLLIFLRHEAREEGAEHAVGTTQGESHVERFAGGDGRWLLVVLCGT